MKFNEGWAYVAVIFATCLFAIPYSAFLLVLLFSIFYNFQRMVNQQPIEHKGA